MRQGKEVSVCAVRGGKKVRTWGWRCWKRAEQGESGRGELVAAGFTDHEGKVIRKKVGKHNLLHGSGSAVSMSAAPASFVASAMLQWR